MTADYWTENLRECAIEGIELPIESRLISGGHEFGRHRYQGRGGQDTEPTGRSPITITIDVPLYASVNPEHYPIRYTQILAVLTDDALGGQVTYVDPVFGELPMQVVSWSGDEQAARRNGGTIKISMEERSTEALNLSAPIVVPRPASQATSTARRLDVALPSLGVLEERVIAAFTRSGFPLSGDEATAPIGALLGSVTQGVISRFESTIATIDFVRGEVDAFRARIDALIQLPEILASEAWDTRRALVSLADSVEQAGLEVIGKRGVEATYTPAGGSTTAHAIAARAFGDSSRWLDVVAANGQVRNPLRIGSTTTGPLRVYLPRRRQSAPGLRA